MPVRTSAVVGGGLMLLTIVGVATIFGESLLAFVAPPAVETTAGTAAAAAPTSVGAPAPSVGKGPQVPAGSAGGANGLPAAPLQGGGPPTQSPGQP